MPAGDPLRQTKDCCSSPPPNQEKPGLPSYFRNMRNSQKRAIIHPMRANLIHGLLSSCRHQFSWPRRDETGANYQVCVHCGVKYSYDWTTMRRVAPLETQEDDLDSGRKPMRKCGTKKAWIPRERRLRHHVPVLFRVPGNGEWVEGVTENISRSGLLFRSTSPVEVGSSLEFILAMPRELTGEEDARVVCIGSLLRVEPVAPTRKQQPPSFLLACTIAQYSFAPAQENTNPAQS
jgi:PilZ domain